MARTDAEKARDKAAAKAKRAAAIKRINDNAKKARSDQARVQRDRATAQSRLQQDLKNERLAEERAQFDDGTLTGGPVTNSRVDDETLLTIEQKYGLVEGITNRTIDEQLAEQGNYTTIDPTGIPDTFSDVAGEGLDESSISQDIIDQYGGLATEGGRRGSQARDSIFQEGDPLVQGFVGSDAYASLQNDPTAITDEDIQKQLTDAGIDWAKFAYGRQNDSTGDISYDKVDFEMLDKYLQSRLNPLKGVSAAADIYGSGSPATATPDVIVNSSTGTQAPPPPISLNSQNAPDPNAFATKKV